MGLNEMEKLEEYIEKEIQFYKDGGSPKIVIVALEEVLEKIVAFKKAELQRKASIIFKIRKMIDDWCKEYCIDKKCAGMLDCKLCLECEIGMRKGAYKDVLKILDKPPMEACVIVSRKKLEEFLVPANMGEWIRLNSPAPTIGDLLRRFIEEKLLGVEK